MSNIVEDGTKTISNFTYSSERPGTGISKPNYVKGISLLSRTFKLNYMANKLIPYKCLLLWKTQPKLFEICTSWYNKPEPVFKPNYV